MLYHVYDYRGFWVGERSEPDALKEAVAEIEEEDEVEVNNKKSLDSHDDYELVQLRGGPRHGEWNIIYLKGDNYIPAEWVPRNQPIKDDIHRNMLAKRTG